MKTKTLIIIALTFASPLIHQATAADAFLSPRAALAQHELRTIPGSKANAVTLSSQVGSPRGLAAQASVGKVQGTSTDTIFRGVLPASPRVLASEPWRLQQIQLAPLR